MFNFIKKASRDEFVANLEQNLEHMQDPEKQLQQQHNKQAIDHLLAAAKILDELQLTKQASVVTNILEKFASQTDPATKNLTPEKEVNNLKEHGTVLNKIDSVEFSNPDQNNAEIIDVVEPEPGESIIMDRDGELDTIDPTDTDIGYILKKDPKDINREDLAKLYDSLKQKDNVEPEPDILKI